MHLQHAPLHERHEPLRVVSAHVHGRSLAFGNLDPIDRGVDALVGVLLIEALIAPAVRATDERQRASLDMRHDPRRDPLEVSDHFDLGDAGFGKVRLVRV